MISIRIRDFNIFIDPVIILLIPVILILGQAGKYFGALASIILHEGGHMAAAMLLGGSTNAVRILPVGLNADININLMDKKARLVVYLCGPVINLVLAGVCWILNSYYLKWANNMSFFVITNIMLALFNLLPILPLDGGKILREILVERFGLFFARAYMRNITMILAAILTASGLWSFISNRNLSVLMIGFYVFFSLKYEDTEAAFMNIRDVVYRRSRLLKKGVYPAREIVVIKRMHLGEIIKSFDFDRFHIIYVLDDNLRLERTLTEQEIMDGVLKYSPELTFEEFLKM